MPAPQRQPTLLVTGFGPFPGVRINPAAQLAHELAASRRFARLGVLVKAHVFPTRWAVLERDLPALMDAAKPDAVLHLGVAASRRFLAIETVARPTPSMILPDAGGASAPARRRAGVGAPLRISAPTHALLACLRRETKASRLSNDAGRYLCNAIYHRSLALRAETRTARPTVFIHVPMPDAPRASSPRARARKPSHAETLRALEGVLLTLACAARRSR